MSTFTLAPVAVLPGSGRARRAPHPSVEAVQQSRGASGGVGVVPDEQAGTGGGAGEPDPQAHRFEGQFDALRGAGHGVARQRSGGGGPRRTGLLERLDGGPTERIPELPGRHAGSDRRTGHVGQLDLLVRAGIARLRCRLAAPLATGQRVDEADRASRRGVETGRHTGPRGRARHGLLKAVGAPAGEGSGGQRRLGAGPMPPAEGVDDALRSARTVLVATDGDARSHRGTVDGEEDGVLTRPGVGGQRGLGRRLPVPFSTAEFTW